MKVRYTKKFFLEPNHNESIIENLKKLKQIFGNYEVLKFSLFLLFKNIGFSIFNGALGLILIDKGLKPEVFANLSLVSIPINIFITTKGDNSSDNLIQRELNYFPFIILVYIISLCFTIYYNLLENSLGVLFCICFLICIVIAEYILNFKMHMMKLGFFNRITDRALGGTFLTALYSVSNLSNSLPDLIIYPAIDYFGYVLVGILSIIYSCCFYLFTKKLTKKLDEMDKNDFKMKED